MIDVLEEQMYIAVKNVVLRLDPCEKTYEVILNDRWPAEGAWSSTCFGKEGTFCDLLPLSETHWTERLVRFKTSKVIKIEGKENQTILFQFLSGHYHIFLGTDENYEVAIPFSDSKNWIKEAITKFDNQRVVFVNLSCFINMKKC